jgi:hypothetical protein
MGQSVLHFYPLAVVEGFENAKPFETYGRLGTYRGRTRRGKYRAEIAVADWEAWREAKERPSDEDGRRKWGSENAETRVRSIRARDCDHEMTVKEYAGLLDSIVAQL